MRRAGASIFGGRHCFQRAQPCMKSRLTIVACYIATKRRIREDQRCDAVGVATIELLCKDATPRLAEEVGLRDAEAIEETRETVRILRHRPVMGWII